MSLKHFTLVSIRYIAVLGFQLAVTRQVFLPVAPPFPSAISRYLVSNNYQHIPIDMVASFHPLYRGTWFPTTCQNATVDWDHNVSIRYIAVLGFQRLC